MRQSRRMLGFYLAMFALPAAIVVAALALAASERIWGRR